MDPSEVSVVRAGRSESALLSNLLELYVHDLSPLFPQVELDASGRFGYPKLPLYLDETGEPRRFAFLIRAGERIAGFALVTRGSPVTDDPDVYDVAEFFVLRRHRRSGVGRLAAHALFRELPGRWTLRVLERNEPALAFWSGVARDFTGGAATEFERREPSGVWRVFALES